MQIYRKGGSMILNKDIAGYVIDIVERLNRGQKQFFWAISDLISFIVAIVVSYVLFYTLINPNPFDYIVYVVPLLPQKVRCGKSHRTAADDCNGFTRIM